MHSFGSEGMRRLFFSDVNSVRLNHGSFGLAPAPVMKKRFELLTEQESQPDVWYRVNMGNYYLEAVDAAASIIGADQADTFVVDNITTGINCVLKSLKFEPDAEILLTSHTYLGVENTAKNVENNNGFKRSYITISFPIKDEDELVKLYEDKLSENSKIKLAIIDHITSTSAIKMPVKKLVDLCRKHNVISIIDGAHAPGQIKLSMKEIGADFYAGNFHKWMLTARSCGFLWVSPPYRGKILPMITSNYTDTSHRMFSYLGTRDDSNLYSLPTALQFYKSVGGLDAITAYADELLTWAQAMLCDALDTQPLKIPTSMRAPCMAIVGLPPWPSNKTRFSGDNLIVQFWKDYSVQVSFTEFNGDLWLRMSASIYNRREDFLKLRDSLLDFYEIK